MTQQVNLYQQQFRPVSDPIGATRLVGIVMASLLVLGGTWGFTSWRLAESRQDAAQLGGVLEARRAELAEVARVAGARRTDAGLEQALARAESLHRARTELMALLESGALGTPGGFSGQMRALARQSEAGLWLTGFDLSATQVELQGRALSAELVPGYLRRLGTEKAMEGVSFNGLRIGTPARPAGGGQAASDASRAGQDAPRQPAFVEFVVASDSRRVETGPGSEVRR
jgi:Tfp pilus assembly protein PilN